MQAGCLATLPGNGVDYPARVPNRIANIIPRLCSSKNATGIQGSRGLVIRKFGTLVRC